VNAVFIGTFNGKTGELEAADHSTGPDWFFQCEKMGRAFWEAFYDGRAGFGTVFEMSIHIRQAVPADVPILRELIDASVRGLQAQDYTAAQMEGALKTVFGVDSQLIADRTYLVAAAGAGEEAGSVGSPGAETGVSAILVGCGGWSKRKTLYGGDQFTEREDLLLDPSRDAAKIRAFFIHPAWARRGIGTMILDACEAAARAAGFSRYEMGATLTGAKLFGARGYVPLRRIEIPLWNGELLPVIHMEKRA
jgi:GNAT superfamily N-acetyltransferase